VEHGLHFFAMKCNVDQEILLIVEKCFFLIDLDFSQPFLFPFQVFQVDLTPYEGISLGGSYFQPNESIFPTHIFFSWVFIQFR
jgi:hypothetical protein